MHKILVVDDEPDIVDILEAFLEDSFSVVPATSFEVAIESLSNQKIDLVLTDLNMPGVQASEIVDRYKSASSESLVVVMSGHSAESPQVKHALETGARGAIEKPFRDPGEIIEVLQNYLAESSKKAG